MLRDLGLVAQVFNEQQLQALPGEVAIGHTRYSTTGGVHWSNAQPLVHHGRARTVALGHNGNLDNAGGLRDELVADGDPPRLDHRHRAHRGPDRARPGPAARGRRHAMRRLEGAYSVVALSDGTLVAFRDAHGVRPLVLGRIGDDWVVASETCALDLIGADVRARRAARRGAVARRRGAPQPRRRCPRAAAPLHLRARLLRPPRQPARRHRGAHEPRADGRSGSPRRRPSRPTS